MSDDEMMYTNGPHVHWKDLLTSCPCWIEPYKEIESLQAKLEEMTVSEHKLSATYLQIRALVNAFDTPHAPTPEQIYSLTEDKIRELKEKLACAVEGLERLKLEAKGPAYVFIERTLQKIQGGGGNESGGQKGG